MHKETKSVGGVLGWLYVEGKDCITGKTSGTDSGIINLVTVASEGGQFMTTANVEGDCIILLAAGPCLEGDCTAGKVVKNQVAINFKNIAPLTKCPTGCKHLERVLESKIALHLAKEGQGGCVAAETEGEDPMFEQASVTTSLKTKVDVEKHSGEMAMDVATIALVHPNDVQCQVIKDVGKTVGSNAKCTANEFMVVVSVHGSDKKGIEQKASAPDSGGGMPDALSSDSVDGAPEASVINGDNYSGGDDRDQCATDRTVDKPQQENGADSCQDFTVSQCSKEVVENVKKESLVGQQIITNSLPTMTNQLGLSYSNHMSICVEPEKTMCDSSDCRKVFAMKVSYDVNTQTLEALEATSAGGLICTFVAQESAKQTMGKQFNTLANLDEAAVDGVVAQGGASIGDAEGTSSSDAILSLSGAEITGGATIKTTDCNIMTLILKIEAHLMVVDNQMLAETNASQGECETVVDNKSSGKPQSIGTFVVCCGAFQTEAMPDTDVNGTAKAMVKDKGIGKEQQTITLGLIVSLDDEADCTAKDVELYVEEDKKCKDETEACNQIDSSVHLIEQIAKESGDKAFVDTKKQVEDVAVEVCKVSDGMDADVTKVVGDKSQEAGYKSVEAAHLSVQVDVVVGDGVVQQGGLDDAADVDHEAADDDKDNQQ